MKASADPDAPLVAVDWGSTNLRAKLVKDGRIVAGPVCHPDGIRHRKGRDFDEILGAHCGAWGREFPGARVLMSGMIGSREGWQEVPYVEAPAGLESISRGGVSVASRHFEEVRLVPGVRFDDPGTGTTDVMRGEETQVMGALACLASPAEEVLCLPGTHSKWVNCREGAIVRFRTFPTGEVFDLLRNGSLIAGHGQAKVEPESPAFARGVALSGSDSGLLHHLFLGRTEMLTGRVSIEALPSLLSGMLIGHEIREAGDFAPGPVRVIGDSPVARATLRALDLLDIAASRVDDDVHLAGLLALDRRAQT